MNNETQLSEQNDSSTASIHASEHTQEFSMEVHPASAGIEILALWKQLDKNLPNVPLACSYLWTKNWLEHFGDIVKHRFAVAIHNNKQVGIALLTEGVGIKNGPFLVRSLHLGTAGEPEADSVCVEYNSLLIDPELRPQFGKEILNLFHREPEWDEFCIDGWEQAELHRVFGDMVGNWEARMSRSFYHNLEETRTLEVTPVSRMGKSTRKAVSRNRGYYGETQTEWAETIDHAYDIFEDLMALHQARWTAAGKPGCYSSEQFLGFHQGLIRDLVPEQKMTLFRVTNADGVVGCVQLMLDNNRALVYQEGCIPYQSNRSPGLLTDSLCLETCLERGYRAFDLLGGESYHKERLSTEFNTLVWANFRRPRLKFIMVEIARRCKQLFIRK